MASSGLNIGRLRALVPIKRFRHPPPPAAAPRPAGIHVPRGPVRRGLTLAVPAGFVEHAYSGPDAGWARRIGYTLEMTVTTQSAYMERDEVAQLIGIPNGSVRVIPTACGGGFGGKLDLSVQPLIAIAALVWLAVSATRDSTVRPRSLISRRRTSRSTTTGSIRSVTPAMSSRVSAARSWNS